MADPHAAAGIGVGSGQDRKTADAKATLTDGQFIKPRGPFPFLELPREIRDEIYAYAMVPGVVTNEEALCNPFNDDRINFKNCWGFQCQRQLWYLHGCRSLTAMEEAIRIQSVTPGLLLTNHQVYLEALRILYGRNFFADDFNPPQCFFTLFGHSSQYVRNLRFDLFWSWPNSGKYLESLVHLQHLSVDLQYDGWSKRPGLSESANLFFEKAYRWIYGVASTKGGRFRAVEYLYVDCPSKCNGQSTGHIKGCKWDSDFKAQLMMLIKAGDPTSSVPFLKFPRKIRDMIYVSHV